MPTYESGTGTICLSKQEPRIQSSIVIRQQQVLEKRWRCILLIVTSTVRQHISE